MNVPISKTLSRQGHPETRRSRHQSPQQAAGPPPPVPQRPRGSAPTVTPGPGAPRQPPQGGQRRERPEGGGGGPGPGRAGCWRVPVSLRSGAFRCLLLTGVRALWPGPHCVCCLQPAPELLTSAPAAHSSGTDYKPCSGLTLLLQTCPFPPSSTLKFVHKRQTFTP